MDILDRIMLENRRRIVLPSVVNVNVQNLENHIVNMIKKFKSYFIQRNWDKSFYNNTDGAINRVRCTAPQSLYIKERRGLPIRINDIKIKLILRSFRKLLLNFITCKLHNQTPYFYSTSMNTFITHIRPYE